MHNPDDIIYMRKALQLARRGLGCVWPNPSVGCVLVKNGKIISSARTCDGGRPHAEYVALQKLGGNARGATAYVTLEPCRHETTTPSCARELINAGVSRVVIGCLDPDPRTSGMGAALLRGAGIEVSIGISEKECMDLNIGFFNKINIQRPFINLKTATSLDGHVAMSSGESKWITGEFARKHVHRMRSEYDAILTGVGTVLADDPQLTSRIGKVVRSPVRIILDSRLRTPISAKVLRDDTDVYVFHESLRDTEAAKPFLELPHVHLVEISPRDLNAVLHYVAVEIGITRIMVEAGTKVISAFVQAGCFDRLSWYRAPMIMGGTAQNITSGLNISMLSDAVRLKRMSARRLGEDLLEIYENRK